MVFLQGLAWLLLCQSVGELAARGPDLRLPGPVLGMLLLFVPVSVGVIVHLGLVAPYGLRLAAVLLLSTLVGVAVTALLLRRLL